MDLPLLIITALLAATLAAFTSGLFPYPYGLIVLIVLLVVRLLTIGSRRP